MADYVTLATLKAALNITDSTRDALLTAAISAASKGIDRDTGRRFDLDSSVSARIYRPSPGSSYLIVDDIGTITGLVVEIGSVDGGWAAVTDYELQPDNALARGIPITALTRNAGSWGSGTARVRVTARWGWPAVPEEVTQAALIQAARLFKRKDSPEGVAGSAEWGAIRLTRIDPDVYALTKHFVLPGF